MQADDVAAVIAERAAEVGATVLWEGRDFGVAHRVPAVGGQMLPLQGLRGGVRRGLPAAVRRPPGAERRRRAGRRRGVPRRRTPLDADLVRGAFEEVTLAGPARGHPPQPDDPARRRPQPARRGRGRGRARGLLHVRPADRRGRRDGGQGLRGRARRLRAARWPPWSAPRTTARGRCRPRTSPRSRAASSASTGCTSPRGSHDAIDQAATLAEEGGVFGEAIGSGAVLDHRVGRHGRRGPPDAPAQRSAR